MRTETSTPPEADHDDARPVRPSLFRSITRPEIMVAALVAVVMLVLVLIEPNILEAPFQNERTLLFTFGGTVIAALAYVGNAPPRRAPGHQDRRADRAVGDRELVADLAVLRRRRGRRGLLDLDLRAGRHPRRRPATAAPSEAPLPTAPVTTGNQTGQDVPATTAPLPAAPEAAQEPPPPAPSDGPVLLGAGQFVGLAGHSGTGDAGIFRNPDGSLVLRFENFDIENGPDLEVYLVPGRRPDLPARGLDRSRGARGQHRRPELRTAGGHRTRPRRVHRARLVRGVQRRVRRRHHRHLRSGPSLGKP